MKEDEVRKYPDLVSRFITAAREQGETLRFVLCRLQCLLRVST